jgi:hypothetical protein
VFDGCDKRRGVLSLFRIQASISLSQNKKATNNAHIKLVYNSFVIKQQLRSNYLWESVKHLPQLGE